MYKCGPNPVPGATWQMWKIGTSSGSATNCGTMLQSSGDGHVFARAYNVSTATQDESKFVFASISAPQAA